MSWNDEALEKLRELWMSGYSLGLIAPKLTPVLGRTCTRNMVSGMVWRLGLPKRRTMVRRAHVSGLCRSSVWTPEIDSKLKILWAKNIYWHDILDELGINVSYSSLGTRAWRLGVSRPATKHKRKSFARTLSMMGLDFNAPPLEERKSLLNLERHDCRYPIGEPEDESFSFCARPVAKDESYCPAHYVICHKAKS